MTAHSNALDLDPRAFTWKDPRRIEPGRRAVLERTKWELRRQFGRD